MKLLIKADPRAAKNKKAQSVEDEDGVLTPAGMAVAHQYAVRWRTKQQRAMDLERQYPQLAGLFYDIRQDSELAAEHAIPMEKSDRSKAIIPFQNKGARYVIGTDFAKPENGDSTVIARVLEKGEMRMVIPLESIQNRTEPAPDSRRNRVPEHVLSKASAAGPFIGPRGGKWADAAHTIPWKEGGEQSQGQLKIQAKTPGRVWVDHKEGLPRETTDKYRLSPPPRGAKPVYSPERQAVHQPIIDSFFRSPATGKPVPKPAEGAQKVAIVMMGGTASGKTTAVKRLLGVQKGSEIEDKGFVNFNPDDVKERLPEYGESIDFKGPDGETVTARDAAFMVHEESSDVAHSVLARALNEGYNVVVDGTGKNADNHIETIKDLKRRGYRVQLVMPDVDIEGPDGAAARAVARAERSGRFVPMGPPPPGTPDILRDIHMQIPVNFERVARECDEFTLFDGRGFPPEVKWKGGKDRADEVIDNEWLEQFRRRGQQLKTAHDRWQAMKRRDKGAPAPSIEAVLQKAEGGDSVGKKEWEEETGKAGPKKFKGAGKVPKAGILWPVTHGAEVGRIHEITYAKKPKAE